MEVLTIGNWLDVRVEEKDGEKVTHYTEYTIDDEFVRDVYEPYTEPEEEPTEEDYQAQILLNQMEILNNQADMDAVIAEILLNQE